MSILIKGLEMPSGCEHCPFCIDYWATDDKEEWRCVVNMHLIEFFDTRLDSCPLIEVPPHGRLIDADALIAKQQEDADLFINPYTLMEKSRRDEALNAVANIVNAPTILEAEEDE